MGSEYQFDLFPTGLNVLSLFDGMSCGRIALDRANIEVANYYSSEIDNYTNHVSNTQRYKMIGNGWSIDTIVHILNCGDFKNAA